MNQGKYYYEHDHGVYYLMEPDGEIQEFSNHRDMFSYVDDPSALFIEVTAQNWQRLYDSGELN